MERESPTQTSTPSGGADLREVVDIARYPIEHPGAPLDALVAEANAALEADGCVVLKSFVRLEWIPQLVAECDRVAARAHRSFNDTNVYFTADHPGLPLTHPLRRFYPRSSG